MNIRLVKVISYKQLFLEGLTKKKQRCANLHQDFVMATDMAIPRCSRRIEKTYLLTL